MSIIRLIVLAVTGLAVAGPLAAKDSRWAEYRTPNFILYTDSDEAGARDFVVNLEKYRTAVGLLAGLELNNEYEKPLVVYGYRRTSDYHRNHDRSKSTGGMYSPQPGGAVALLTLDEPEVNWASSGQEILFHEYTHHVTGYYSPYNYPRWYNEGFAEYLSTMQFRDNLAIVGAPPPERLAILKSDDGWLDLDELLEAKNEYIGVIGRTGTSRGKARNAILYQYAQGWLTTHFLLHSPEYRGGLPTYLAALDDGAEDLAAAFEAAFGADYDTVNDALRRYWFDRKLQLSGVDLTGSLPEITIERRTLKKREAEALPYVAAITFGGLEERQFSKARKALTAALDAGVRPADMLHGLAFIAYAEEDFAQVRRHTARMLEIDASDVRALTLDAEAQFHELEDQVGGFDKLTPDTLAAARAQSVKAVQADPTYVPALMAYTEHYTVKDAEVTSAALKAIDSAVNLMPNLPDVRMQRADLLAKAGEYEDAKADMRQLISWAHSDAAREGYVAKLEKIEALEAENEQKEAGAVAEVGAEGAGG